MPRLRRENAKGLKNGTDHRFSFWESFSRLQRSAKCQRRETLLTFLYLVIILAASGKRSVHKGVIQPNFCTLRGILMCVPFFGLPSTRLHFLTARKYAVLLICCAQIFYLVKKWIFQICRNFHIFRCLPLKWNLLKDSSGHPYSIYFIDKKQGKRDQGSISGIRIIPKRWLSPLNVDRQINDELGPVGREAWRYLIGQNFGGQNFYTNPDFPHLCLPQFYPIRPWIRYMH